MSKGLPRSKKGLTSTQNTVIIPLAGSRIIPAQPLTGTTPAQISGQTAGVAGSLISVAVGAPGFGSVLIQGLPKGNVQIEEVLANLQFICTDANLTQTFTGNFSIGTAAATSNVLAGNNVNVVPSTAISAATAGVSPLTLATPAALSLVLNNSDSVSGTGTRVVQTQPSIAVPSGNSSQTIKTGPALGFYLNLTLSTVTTAAVNVTVNGQIVVTYSVTGNY